jgi:pyrroline-5-carboxylate reductase
MQSVVCCVRVARRLRAAARRLGAGPAAAPAAPVPLPKLGFVGGGRMASAMVGGLLASGLVPASDIFVSDPNQRARDRLLAAHPGVTATADNAAVAREAGLVVLAVKPQSLKHVMGDLHGQFRADGVLLSVVAGATMEQLAAAAGLPAVVRCMPNTPAAVLHSMSVWAATPAVTDASRAAIRQFLRTFGSEIFVADEGLLDMATALSGSGPAYFLLVLESLIDTGVHLGFTREQARTLVVQTMLGSARLAAASDRHLADLRNDITSPGARAWGAAPLSFRLLR